MKIAMAVIILVSVFHQRKNTETLLVFIFLCSVLVFDTNWAMCLFD